VAPASGARKATQATNRVARKNEFPEAHQADLGCPDGKRKIFGFTRMANHRLLMAIPPS
jgi:hypothetical protein